MVKMIVTCDVCGVILSESSTGDVHTFISPAPKVIPEDTTHFHITAFSKAYGKLGYDYCPGCLANRMQQLVNVTPFPVIGKLSSSTQLPGAVEVK